jgi:BMFP domain-containing protein YqiC
MNGSLRRRSAHLKRIKKMQTDNPILDDLAKLAGAAAGTMHGVKQEIEAAVKARVERLVSELDLVPREEFEVVRDMARLARQDNDVLREKIAELEARLPNGQPAKRRARAESKKSKK